MRVSRETIPEWVTQLQVLIDHHTLYVCGTDSPEGWIEARTTEEAATGPNHAAARWGLIAIDVPMQTYEDAPVTLEKWNAEPPADDDGWDFVVDAALPIPGERIYMWGGGGTEPVSFDLPQGTYMARVAARGYGVSEPREAKGEFRVRVWPAPVRVIKAWPGW